MHNNATVCPDSWQIRHVNPTFPEGRLTGTSQGYFGRQSRNLAIFLAADSESLTGLPVVTGSPVRDEEEEDAIALSVNQN